MYALIVYDVEVSRVAKVHKYLKRHLHWVQNSVFEGEVTEAQLAAIKIGLEKLLDSDIDSVIVFTAREARWLDRQVLGCERGDTGNVI